MSRERFATQVVYVRGIRIRVGIRRVRGNAQPLLIFNGIGASLELLEPFLAAFPYRDVICYDVPGAGESKTPRLPWRMRHHARLAAELLDRLEYASVAVMGISWGGALAQQFAHQYSRRCTKLLLAATSPGQLMWPPRLNVIIRMTNPLRYWSPDLMVSIAPKIYGGSLRTNKALAREHARKMKPPTIAGYYHQIAAVAGWSSLLWLHRLKQETLVMAGDDDPIMPLVNAKVLTALIPKARLRVVNCGHLFILTRAKDLAPEIESFLG